MSKELEKIRTERAQEAKARNERALNMLYNTEAEYELTDGYYPQGQSDGSQRIYKVENNQVVEVHYEDIYGNKSQPKPIYLEDPEERKNLMRSVYIENMVKEQKATATADQREGAAPKKSGS